MGYFDTTTVTDDTFVLDALVLATVALPISRRAEDFLTKKATFLRLKRAIVDSLGILNFPATP
jgi:hypothetical protein